MKSSASVSFLIITKNRPVLLKKLLSNIRTQSTMPSEIVVVEDTIDHQYFSLDFLNDFFNKKINIKYAETKSNNYAKSRNIAMSLSSAKILIFIDDDLSLQNNFVKKVLQLYKNRPNSIGFCAKVLPIKTNIYSAIGCSFMNGKPLFANKLTRIRRSAFACITLKSKYAKKFRFDELTYTGEDVIYLHKLTSKYKNYFYAPKLIVKHHFADSLLGLTKKGFIAGKDFPYQTRTIRTNFDLEYYPVRKLHIFFFPFFLIFKCIDLSKNDLVYFKLESKYMLPLMLLRLSILLGIYTSEIGREKLIRRTMNIIGS